MLYLFTVKSEYAHLDSETQTDPTSKYARPPQPHRLCLGSLDSQKAWRQSSRKLPKGAWRDIHASTLLGLCPKQSIPRIFHFARDFVAFEVILTSVYAG